MVSLETFIGVPIFSSRVTKLKGTLVLARTSFAIRTCLGIFPFCRPAVPQRKNILLTPISCLFCSSLLDAPLTIAALRMALRQGQPGKTLIVHSDRGSQFASAAYRQVLAEHGLLASMSRAGNCYDNAFIESFWSSLKYELVYHRRFATHAEARTAIFDYIETFYNRTRLHSALGYRSPRQFEQLFPSN